MTLIITDVIDPGTPGHADGSASGIGPGTAAQGGSGGRKGLAYKTLTLTFSGTYATGGSAITVAQMGGLKAEFVDTDYVGGVIYVPFYQSDGSLILKQFWKVNNAVAAEITNATAIAAVVRLHVWGRQA